MPQLLKATRQSKSLCRDLRSSPTGPRETVPCASLQRRVCCGSFREGSRVCMAFLGGIQRRSRFQTGRGRPSLPLHFAHVSPDFATRILQPLLKHTGGALPTHLPEASPWRCCSHTNLTTFLAISRGAMSGWVPPPYGPSKVLVLADLTAREKVRRLAVAHSPECPPRHQN